MGCSTPNAQYAASVKQPLAAASGDGSRARVRRHARSPGRSHPPRARGTGAAEAECRRAGRSAAARSARSDSASPAASHHACARACASCDVAIRSCGSRTTARRSATHNLRTHGSCDRPGAPLSALPARVVVPVTVAARRHAQSRPGAHHRASERFPRRVMGRARRADVVDVEGIAVPIDVMSMQTTTASAAE